MSAVDLTGLLALQVIFRQCRVDILVTAFNTEQLPCAMQKVTDLACIVSFALYSKHEGQELLLPLIYG